MTAAMNKAQRLAVAGVVAPFLRDQSAATTQRRVAVIPANLPPDAPWAENVKSYTTLAKAQQVQLERQRIEIEVVEGVRPKTVVCENCARTIQVARYGGIPRVCPRSGCDPQTVCPGWGETEGTCDAVPKKNSLNPSVVKARGGQPWRCKSCAGRRILALDGLEVRRERARRAQAAMTPESRSDRVRRAQAAMTPEQRARKALKVRRAKARAKKKASAS